MNRFFFLMIGFVAILVIFATTAPTIIAEVNVNIGVSLPGLFFPGPPALVVVPGSYVYYPPEVDVDVFFYHGYWYRPYGGGWYIAKGYNGPWHSVGPRRVPRPLLNMPPAYRGVSHDRMPYPVVQRNWRTWENERRWDNDGHNRHNNGRREHGEHGRGHGRRD